MSREPNRKRKRSSVSESKMAASPNVALPPPMVPYHFIPYPVYSAGHPYYLPVHPAPLSPRQSPTLASNSQQPPRLLPKTSPSPFYPFQLSPQLAPHPTRRSGSTADEREQARKISHSAIERRRRERINDKITQLKDLIPSCAEGSNLHKMTVLQGAIDYITFLRKVVEDLGKDPDQMPIKKKPKAVSDSEEEDSPSDQKQTVTRLQPMDLLKEPSLLPSSPPERNMNLENLLC
ncbi:Myc-type, basic helix-loop-helix domain-containing protein [Sporodiniella umbellata]|nr:Myc-type, basic helix-loop-helix domain-containing protein [Sporodiniella umbellata]